MISSLFFLDRYFWKQVHENLVSADCAVIMRESGFARW